MCAYILILCVQVASQQCVLVNNYIIYYYYYYYYFATNILVSCDCCYNVFI